MFIGKYGRLMFAPDTGADGGAVASESNGVKAESENTDWEALYKKELAEKTRYKQANDALASENAEYKRQSKAKMSEEEKREAELSEERERWKTMANELNEIKVSNVFAKNGYDEKDYAELSKKLVEVGGSNAHELAEVFVEFVKKANQMAVANAKNSMIKDGAVPPKTSTAQADTKSDYQLYQESKKKTNNIVEL